MLGGVERDRVLGGIWHGGEFSDNESKIQDFDNQNFEASFMEPSSRRGEEKLNKTFIFTENSEKKESTDALM